MPWRTPVLHVVMRIGYFHHGPKGILTVKCHRSLGVYKRHLDEIAVNRLLLAQILTRGSTHVQALLHT